MNQPQQTVHATDILNIGGDSIPELDAVTSELVERGKHERVMILAGTEAGANRSPYAVTKVEIKFDNERDLLNCVRLLRWSDERLRARPEHQSYYAMLGATPDRLKMTHSVLGDPGE